MDTAQWSQGIGVVKPFENSIRPGSVPEKKPRPPKEQALNCPRCNSTNTKFCYYNNYSLSQPRYFCKTCRRYWTEGGSLRNVPVGGGSRKNKRSSSSTSINNNPCSISPNKVIIPNLTPPDFSPQSPKIHEGHDLNLAYNPTLSSHYNINNNRMSEFVGLPIFGLDHHTKNLIKYPQGLNNPSDHTHHHLPVMELLKSTGTDSTGLSSSFMSSHVPISDSNTVVFSSSSGFDHDHFKPSLGFFLDQNNNVYGNMQEVEEASSRTLFPFQELKPLSNNQQQDRCQAETNGYWNGMLGGGGSW